MGKKDNTDEYFEESRDLLSKNNILPFLSNYNYDLVISKIEKRIKCSERIDSNFIDSFCKAYYYATHNNKTQNMEIYQTNSIIFVFGNFHATLRRTTQVIGGTIGGDYS